MNDENAPVRRSDDDLMDVGVQLVLAMMRSASYDDISAMQWWPRARTALETATATAEAWPHLISVMGRKLQISGALENWSAKEVCSIGTDLDEREFRRFCDLMSRDAIYVVAMAQAQQQARKAARREDADEEEMF